MRTWLVLAVTREGAVFLLRPDKGARVRRLGISARDLAWR
jgi:hypothetical protein